MFSKIKRLCLTAWRFLKDESSRQALTLIGAFLTAIIGGAWVLFAHFSDNPKKSDLSTLSNIQNISMDPNVTNIQNQIQSNSAPVHVTQYIGYTVEQYERALKAREVQIRADLNRAHAAEKTFLERELSSTQQALANVGQSYEKKLKQLQAQIDSLQGIKALVPHDAFSQAQQALQQGDTKLADTLYASVQSNVLTILAEAAYQRGLIAEDEVRFQDAFKHYVTASELEPNNEKFLEKLVGYYFSSGLSASAEKIYKRLYQINYKKYGEYSPEFAAINNNFAVFYSFHKKYVEAEPLQEKAIEIGNKIKGLDSQDLATWYHNLAVIYQGKGEDTKAESAYRMAIEIAHKSAVVKDSYQAIRYHNLANLYEAQHKYNQAEAYYKRAVEIGEKTLEFGHPDLATSYFSLAHLYKQQGKYTKAEHLYKKAIIISEKTLGLKHSETIAIATDYIRCLELQDKPTVALRKKFGLD